MTGLIQYHQPVNMSLVHDFVRELRGGVNALRNPMLVSADVERNLDSFSANHATRAAYAAAQIVVESGASLPMSRPEPSDPIVTEKGDWSPLGISCLES